MGGVPSWVIEAARLLPLGAAIDDADEARGSEERAAGSGRVEKKTMGTIEAHDDAHDLVAVHGRQASGGLSRDEVRRRSQQGKRGEETVSGGRRS